MSKSRWLVQTLVLSIGLNAVLLCVFFYFLIRKNPISLSYKPKIENVECDNSVSFSIKVPFLEKLQKIKYVHLVDLLKDTRNVEQGYRVQDFALGALASYHDFDVERGLERGHLRQKKWEFKGKHFFLFPGCTQADFEKLQLFAKEEKWPFTTKGLFRKIARDSIENSEPALLYFFCHTPQFIVFETLFARTQVPIQKKRVLKLALEGGWDLFEQFHLEQLKNADFSSHVRRNLLLNAIARNSTEAAMLLLLTDEQFALQQLEDQQMYHLLDLLPQKKELLPFVQQIASSPRDDRVCRKASTWIAAYAGEGFSEIAGHYYEKPGLKELRPVFRQSPPAAPESGQHLIQPGESLWIIARKYKTSVDLLMQLNHLQTAVLQPGKYLKIP
jgi:hypothetical protein